MIYLHAFQVKKNYLFKFIIILSFIFSCFSLPAQESETQPPDNNLKQAEMQPEKKTEPEPVKPVEPQPQPEEKTIEPVDEGPDTFTVVYLEIQRIIKQTDWQLAINVAIGAMIITLFIFFIIGLHRPMKK